MFKTEYKKDLDILLVEKEEYRDFGRSIELGGMVLDMDKEDRFLGLEIIEASQKLGIERDELQNLDGKNVPESDLEFEMDDEIIRIKITLEIGNQKNVISSQFSRKASA